MKFIYGLIIVVLLISLTFERRRREKRIHRESGDKEKDQKGTLVKGEAAFFVCKDQGLGVCGEQKHCEKKKIKDKEICCNKHPLNNDGKKLEGKELEAWCATFPDYHCPQCGVCKKKQCKKTSKADKKQNKANKGS